MLVPATRSKKSIHRAAIDALESRRLLASASVSFDPDGAGMSSPGHRIVYDFDANVEASLSPSDVEIYDLTRNQPINSGDVGMTYTSGDVARFDVGGVNYSQWGTRNGLLATETTRRFFPKRPRRQLCQTKAG